MNWRKITLALFLTCFVLTTYGQSKKLQLLEKMYVKEFCSCLSSNSNHSPETLLSKTTAECVTTFFVDKTELIEEVIQEEFPNDTLISEYDKGKIIGKRLAQNTIVNVLRDCEFYRNTLTAFKASVISQSSVTKENVSEAIKQMIENESQVKKTKNAALYLTLIGIMYEFAGDTENALKYYDEALSYSESTSTKALKELLIMK